MTLRLSSLLFLASLLLCLPARAQVHEEGAPLFTRVDGAVTVPAEVADHLMFVSVMINGKGPYRMLVDTGCSVTLVSPEVAEAADGLVASDDENPVIALNGFGNPTDVEKVVFKSIDVGGARFEGVTAAVAQSFSAMSAIYGQRVDGALGYPLFHDLYVGLDYPNKRLLLSESWPKEASTPRTSLAVTEHADVPYVQVGIQGNTCEFMIDTGANQAIHMTSDQANRFMWTQKPRAGALLAVVGEADREYVGRLADSLKLGDVELVEPPVAISSGPSSLGVRSLEKFCVVFHPAEGKLWLCGEAALPLIFGADRSVGLSLYYDPSGWRVAGVIPGSPAESARIAAGSLISKIEGQPATAWSRDQLQTWMDTHTDLSLVVADVSGPRSLKLPVWDLLP